MTLGSTCRSRVIDYARARKVTAQYDIEDLRHDVETIRK